MFDYNEPINAVNLKQFKNTIIIDSAYIYTEDLLYKEIVNNYNSKGDSKSRSLSPEDDSFFNKEYIVKSTESTLLYGKNYIYPGAILEGNSISDHKYVPLFISNRNPITVSSTLTHTLSKPTSQTIEEPSYSKLSDYVKDMVVG